MQLAAAVKELRRSPGKANGSPSTDSLGELLDAWVTPPHSAGGLIRARLLARLDAALHHRLTLLSAAPGAGKTALLAHWAASFAAMPPPPRVAWLTLGPECHAPTLLAFALETALLRAGALMQPFSDGATNVLTPEAVLVRLTVSQFAAPTVLILDGVEQLGAINHTLLAYLAEQAPPQLHLVLAARREATLPLWALRRQGSLLELGDQELRWSQAEVDAWLNGVLGLGLRRADVAALVRRTGGWSAGLRLAALALQAQRREGEADTLSKTHPRLVEAIASGLPAAPLSEASLRETWPAPERSPDKPLLVEPLSDRERQIIALIAAGLPNREIAGQLWISEGTVKTHLKRIFGKIGAHNRTEAVAIARREGVISV